MIRPDQRIEVAERALGAGQQATAQRLLVSVVEDHPEQGYAWFLLSQTTDDAQQRSRYLHRAVQAGYKTTIPLEMLQPPATNSRPPLLPIAGPAATTGVPAPARHPGATFLRGGCFACLIYGAVLGLALLAGADSITINLSWLAIWFVAGGVIALIGAAFNPRAS